MESAAGTADDSGNMPHKVVAVAAGEAHTLALSGDGYVYSWGRGMFGRLGTGSESDEIFPVRVKFQNSELKLIAVAAGAYHSLALADDGSVWSWGYNVYGQLGLHGENSLAPQLMERFLELGSPGQSKDELETKSKAPLKICAVKAGGMTSLAIDNLGALWMWGNCPQDNNNGDGSLTFVSCFTPIPVWDFHGHTVVKVACGNEHVVALVSAGERHKGDDLLCYSWGGNGHGQLGLGDTESRARPEIVGTFSQDIQWTVYEVACGAFHTALLTRKKRPSDTLESMCWTFGLGDKGQLGHGTTQSALVPEPVKELPQPVYLVSVDCGLFHTSVVSSAGDVWSWGMEKGLGLCPDASFTGTDSGDAISPLRIHGPKFNDPVQVSCGAAHTVLVAHDGYKLWSWGRGRSGVLGNGKTVDCFSPTIVLWPPLNEDFKQEELNQDDKIVDQKGSDGVSEMEKKLSLAMEEMKLLGKFATDLTRPSLMEGVGARLGRSSTRYGPVTVFTGPVRKWKKKWVHVSPPNTGGGGGNNNNHSQNHHSNSNGTSNGNNGPHLVLFKWTPITQSQNNNNYTNNSPKEDTVAALEEPPRRKFKYIPIAVLEEQKREAAENEAAENVDDEAKPSESDPSVAEPTSRTDGFDEKPDINDVPMEENEEDDKMVRQDLNESTLDLSLGLTAHDGESDSKPNRHGQLERVKSSSR